jgi:hypothetical protein
MTLESVSKRALTAALLLLIAALAIMVSKPVDAAPGVTWQPSSVTTTIQPGQSKGIPASFTASAAVDNVTVEAVPALQSLVNVTPSSIAHIAKGQTVAITLTVATTSTALPGTFEGTVHLRIGSSTIAKPLPVSVNVVWPSFADPNTGTSFAYPTLGAAGRVDEQQKSDATGPYTVFDISFAAPRTSDVETQYTLVVSANSQSTSLTDWFSTNIDLGAQLLSGAVFTPVVLTNGMNVLLRTGPMPVSYLDGSHDPVAEIYAMSPTTKSIIVVGISNSGALGLNVDQLHQELLAMLGTMQTP